MSRRPQEWVVRVYQDRRRGPAPATAVICCALDVEYQAVLPHVDGPLEVVEERGTRYELGHFQGDQSRWNVVMALAGRENTAAGIQVERAISAFAPQVVLFVGVAGGRRTAGLGDVVAANHVYDYEPAMETDNAVLTRIKTMPTSFRMVQLAHAVVRAEQWQGRIRPSCPDIPPKALVRPIAAGSKVVAGRGAPTALLLDDRCGDAEAVETEGSGVVHGAYVNQGVDALVVRGISDLLAGKDKHADATRQPRAAAHAAAFAFELLAKLVPPAGVRTGDDTHAATGPRAVTWFAGPVNVDGSFNINN
jgi:nucleoside phosphorylase